MTNIVPVEPVSGVEIVVPLNKLRKSPRNARKVPHSEAAIAALAASIAAKGVPLRKNRPLATRRAAFSGLGAGGASTKLPPWKSSTSPGSTPST